MRPQRRQRLNLLKAISAVALIANDGPALGKAVTAALADPAVKAETDSHPGVKAISDRISAEWRTVEQDVTGVHKSNFFTFFSRVSALLQAANLLEKDVAAEQHDPAIGAALATMPNTLAALSKVSGQWVKLEADLKGFA